MSAPWAAAVITLWVVVLLIAVVVTGVLRRIGAVLEQAEARLASGVQDSFAPGGLAVASRAPEFRVFDTNGAGKAPREISSDELIRTPTILLFMSANCAPCRELAAELPSAMRDVDGVPLYAIFDKNEGRPEWLPRDVPTVFESSREVSRAFENVATPQAYLLDSNRLVVTKRVVMSLSDLKAMVATTTAFRGEVLR
jgi:hypothetical protein